MSEGLRICGSALAKPSQDQRGARFWLLPAEGLGFGLRICGVGPEV